MKLCLQDVTRSIRVLLLVVSLLLPGCSSTGGRRLAVPVMVDTAAQQLSKLAKFGYRIIQTGVSGDVRGSVRAVMVVVSKWSGSNMVAVTGSC